MGRLVGKRQRQTVVFFEILLENLSLKIVKYTFKTNRSKNIASIVLVAYHTKKNVFFFKLNSFN